MMSLNCILSLVIDVIGLDLAPFSFSVPHSMILPSPCFSMGTHLFALKVFFPHTVKSFVRQFLFIKSRFMRCTINVFPVDRLSYQSLRSLQLPQIVHGLLGSFSEYPACLQDVLAGLSLSVFPFHPHLPPCWFCRVPWSPWFLLVDWFSREPLRPNRTSGFKALLVRWLLKVVVSSKSNFGPLE